MSLAYTERTLVVSDWANKTALGCGACGPYQLVVEYSSSSCLRTLRSTGYSVTSGSTTHEPSM